MGKLHKVIIDGKEFEIEEAEDDLIGKMSDKDLAGFILADMDYEAQFRAIHGLVQRSRRDDAELEAIIRDKEKSVRASWSWYAETDLIDHYHDSGYHAGAQSMAAVAVLTSFIESLFKHAFLNIREKYEHGPLRQAAHARWTMKAKEQWNCECSLTKPNNIVDGIVQISDATGLLPLLPGGLHQTMGALFLYRNKMFHYGIEWPIPERGKYEKRIEEAGWPTLWFGKATSGDNPWMFYLTDAFIDHCLDEIVSVIDGFGVYVRRHYALSR